MEINVLIVDDDRSLSDALKDLLESQTEIPKVTVWQAFKLNEARQLLAENLKLFDAVILDIVLDGQNPTGLDLAAEIGGDIAVILISALDPRKFIDRAAQLGPIRFLDKGLSSQEFRQKLLTELSFAVSWKSWNKQLDTHAREFRNACIARRFGAVLAVRAHLSPISDGTISESFPKGWALATLALGYRFWENAIEAHRGQLYSFHDVSYFGAFTDDMDIEPLPLPNSATIPTTCIQRAYLACRTASSKSGDANAVFKFFPFGACIIPSPIVSGMFGDRQPGRAAVIGPFGDIASQIVLRANIGEIGTIPGWLGDSDRNWWNTIPATRRSKELRIVGFEKPVDAEFLIPNSKS